MTDRDNSTLQSVIEHIAQIVWLMEWPSLNMIYISPAFGHIWGFSAEDARAHPERWLEAMHEEDRERLWQAVEAFPEDDRFLFDYRMRDATGEERWLRAEGMFFERDERGMPALAAGVTSDITGLKHATAALAEREAMHQAWMQSALDFVVYRIRIDPDREYHQVVEFVSPSIERVMGVSPDAPIEEWFRHVHPDHRERVAEAQRQTAENHTDYDDIIRMADRDDGSERWIRAISRHVEQHEPNVSYFNGLLIDVTDRVTAEAENRLRAEGIEHSLAAFYITDGSGHPIYANRAFIDMWGYRDLDAVRRVPPERFCAQPGLALEILAALENNGEDQREFTARRRDDSTFEVMMSNRTFTDAGGQRFIMGSAIDISERRRAEAALRQAATVFESTAEGVLITDSKGDILAVNRAFSTMTGYSEREVLGRNPRMLRSTRHGRRFFSRMWRSLRETGHWQGEIWNAKKNGDEFPVWLTASRVDTASSSEPATYVALMSDISAVKRSEQQLQHMAHHDSLTGLPNRLLLDARLEHAIERARRDGSRVAVLFLDADRFKNVNDSHGHPAGDELLRELAQRLRDGVREEDTVARIGGDEFVVVLEGVAERSFAALVSEKLIGAISGTVELEPGSVALTASIGIALYPDDGTDPTALLKNADAAMYRAKEDGRNQYQFYNRAMTEGTSERLTLEVDMRRALDRRDQFVVHYQPLIELDSGAIFGVEALLRWQHPERGAVMPGAFIPIAEECGLIEPLGEWVLREACRQVARWRDAGLPPLRVSINISGRQAARPRLVDTVADTLDESGLDAACLALELTETVLMSDPIAAGATLEKLAALGVWLSVDDFGTGYSSLSYLKRFPVNTLKIDRSFVRDAPGDASDAAICRAVLALADSLGLDVVAEGVETRAQRDFLIDSGCVYAQGFLFGRPMPADAIATLLRGEGSGGNSGKITPLRPRGA